MKERLNEKTFLCSKSVIRAFHELASQFEDCVDMSLGELSAKTPTSIIESTRKALSQHETRYASNQGLLELREKISEYENTRKNIHYTADEVIITQGASEAIACVLLSILNEDDEVLLPIPTYSGYENMVNLARGVCVFFQCDDYQIDEEQIRNALTENSKAILLTTPNNPTGCVLNSKSLKIVARIAKEKKLFIILDLVYDKLCDENQFFDEFVELKEQLILIHSFSKTYAMSGFRLGCLMVDKSLIDSFLKVHQSMISCVNTFVQKGAIEALSCNADIYSEIVKKRKYVRSELKRNNIDFIEPKGAFYLFIKIDSYGMDSLTFSTKLLYEYHVVSVPGIVFHDDTGIRLSYSIDDEQLKIGIQRLCLMIKEVKEN